MATKQFMTLENLSSYDTLLKQYIATEDAKSIKSLSVSGNTVSFFKTNDATGTAAYSITIPDVSGFMSKIASATGGKIVTSVAGGEVAESDTAISDLATNEYVGEIPSGSAATTVIGYADEVAGAVASDLTTLENSLADVATSGDADDVSYDNTTSGLTATDVQAAIDEVAAASAGGVDSKTVYVVDNGATSDYAKVYSIYQGSTGSASSPVAAEKLIDVNIPKDKVVSDGSVVDITYNSEDGKLYDGVTDVTALIKGSGTATAADAGKYIKLELQNVTDPLYIFAKDLVDIYTAEQSATQIQLVIDSNNEISATIVAGSVGTTELGSKVVTTAKIADDAITGGQIADDAVGAEHIAITAHTEAQTAGADGIAISVTTTDGQVSSVSASIASETYDTYGSAANAQTVAAGYTDTAIAALDADLDASGTAQYSGTFVVSGVTEVDGVITAVDSVEVEAAGAAAAVQTNVIGTNADAASANTIYGAKAYADASTESIPTSSIEALFSAS